MKEALVKIKAALSKQRIVEHLSHYLIRDGFLVASDGRMTAGAPVDVPGEYLIPGEELELLMGKFGDGAEVRIEGTVVHIAQGKLRGTIATSLLDSVLFPSPGKDPAWLLPCADFLPALRLARPFISDNAMQEWATTAWLRDGSILATTNRSLVEVNCEGLLGADTLLPVWAVDYVLGHGDILTGVLWHERFACFQWSDGSWMHTLINAGKWPEQAVQMLAAVEDPEWLIEQEWRDAYAAVSSVVLEGEPITISADRMEGRRKQAWVSYPAESPTPPHGASQWDPKFLSPVVAIATHIDLTAWPKPAVFVGNGIKGLVVGRMA